MVAIAPIVGFAQIFMIISAQIILTKEAMPEHLRGTVSGCYSLLGAVGIVISEYVGGYLFDIW